MKKVLSGLLMLIVSTHAHALQQIKGQVTLVQATSVPAEVSFQMDVGTTKCPAGAWLSWKNQSWDNNKAVYSLLLAALASGNKVVFMMDDNNTDCSGNFIYIVK